MIVFFSVFLDYILLILTPDSTMFSPSLIIIFFLSSLPLPFSFLSLPPRQMFHPSR